MTMNRWRGLLPSRRRWVVLSMSLVALVVVILVFSERQTVHTDSKYSDFSPAKDAGPSAPKGQKLRYFKTVDNQQIFLFSAIANHREPSDGNLNIIISGFDSTDRDSLQCCVLMKEGKMMTTTTSIFYKFYNEPSFIGPYVQVFFRNTPTKAKQYACVVPDIGFEATHVALTSSSCPANVEEKYLPVIYPKRVPGGLAICGKAAFGDQLDPNKLMEWFEVQRLLGVDHIQIMDADNPEPIQKVFRYYTEMGLLNALPYELPGVPYGRGLDVDRFVRQQGDHDKSFPILDCTQRLKGYTYVLGIDMDEVLVPATNMNLKDFAKMKFMENSDAAGFFFYTQFYVYDWGPTVDKGDITLFRYLNSTYPRNECKKYIYLTSRIFQARTHDFTPKDSYKQYWVPEDEAVLHHYRKCPHVWNTCNPPRLNDPSILRFKGVLEQNLEKARKAIGIRPKS